MQVFKVFFKLLKHYKGVVFLYFGVFMGLALIMSAVNLADGGSGAAFTTQDLNIGIIDRDKGTFGEALMEYFGEEHELEFAEDEEDSILNKLYWRNYDYVLVIPENFERDFLAGGAQNASLSCMKVPGTFSASYFESEIELYLSKISLYMAAGKTLEEAQELTLALRREEAQVTMASFVNENQHDIATIFYQYVPYLFISLGCVGVGSILICFNREELRNRMECASLPLRSRMLGLSAGILTLGGVLFVLVTLISVILSRGALLTDVRLPYFLINMLAMLLFGLALGFFTGTVAKGQESANGICNIAGLGLCFLGGIFVPQEFFGEGVEKIARCVPTYWYVKNVEMIGAMKEVTSEFLRTLWSQSAVILLFAVAFFAVTLVIVSAKRKQA